MSPDIVALAAYPRCVGRTKGASMFCPRCRAEYQAGFTQCADCDIDLVDECPSSQPPDRSSELPVAAHDATAGPRPPAVTVALCLLGCGAALSLITYLAGGSRVSTSSAGAEMSLRATVLFLLLVLGLEVGLLVALAYRRRWAYIAVLVLSLLYLPLLWSDARSQLDRGATHFLLFVVTTALQAIALVLLLRRPAREWFGFSRTPAPLQGEWREDPSGLHQYRFWSGTAWTTHVADDGKLATDPTDGSDPPRSAGEPGQRQ
jgi:hypothetical protein